MTRLARLPFPQGQGGDDLYYILEDDAGFFTVRVGDKNRKPELAVLWTAESARAIAEFIMERYDDE